jgi:hypothetical protein
MTKLHVNCKVTVTKFKKLLSHWILCDVGTGAPVNSTGNFFFFLLEFTVSKKHVHSKLGLIFLNWPLFLLVV